MEIRIGVQHTQREISFESKSEPDEVVAAVEAAIADGSVLRLTDDKGRQHLVPGAGIAYVEVGEATSRRVGFGAG